MRYRTLQSVALLVGTLASATAFSVPADASGVGAARVMATARQTSAAMAASPAPPHVKKLYKPGRIRACEPSRARGGVRIQFTYIAKNPDGGSVVVRIGAGDCMRFHIFKSRRVDWYARRFSSGRLIAQGALHHIQRTGR
jgi:hypothetical protein